MATVVEMVPLTKIVVGQRFREDTRVDDDFIRSIKEKGIIQPITVDQKYNLLAGGRRYAGATAAGLLEIPAIRRTVSDRLDAIEVELYENIYRLDFTWQERAAAEKALWDLRSAKDPEYTLVQQAEDTKQGRSTLSKRIELAAAVAAFPELTKCETAEEAWKTYKKIEESLYVEALTSDAKKKALKGVKIAEKNYIVGDAFAGLEKLRDSEYHWAEVDPPYGVDIDVRKSRNLDKTKLPEYQEVAGKDYPKFIAVLAGEVYRVLRDGSFCIWWYGMSWHNDVLATIRDAGFKVSDIPAIWYKGAQGQTASPDTMLGSCYEPFFICRKGDGKLAKPGRSNVFDFTPLSPARKIHPTEKPQDLMVELIETISYPGTRGVVPFLGSGSTLRACYRTGRIGFGWDLSQEHKKKFMSRVIEDEQEGAYGEDK